MVDKDRVQEIAEGIAEADYGKNFYDLTREQQERVYWKAEAIERDCWADKVEENNAMESRTASELAKYRACKVRVTKELIEKIIGKPYEDWEELEFGTETSPRFICGLSEEVPCILLQAEYRDGIRQTFVTIHPDGFCIGPRNYLDATSQDLQYRDELWERIEDTESIMADPEIVKQVKHQLRHEQLHRCLDELVADMVSQTSMLPSKTSVMELMQWSNEQQQNPTGGNDSDAIRHR